ncbi:hypothetical protein CPC08DRAFT_169387 [Agrocybe pediades]|nr:hypothetical protein CPC08DRAFT_169387 [Agrocybe pediades]
MDAEFREIQTFPRHSQGSISLYGQKGRSDCFSWIRTQSEDYYKKEQISARAMQLALMQLDKYQDIYVHFFMVFATPNFWVMLTLGVKATEACGTR